MGWRVGWGMCVRVCMCVCAHMDACWGEGGGGGVEHMGHPGLKDDNCWLECQGSFLNSPILCFWADLLHSCLMWLRMTDRSFTQHIFYIHTSGVLTALFGSYMASATSAHALCTPYNSLQFYSKPHAHGACACLAVTCHLHFWQNNQDLVLATAVTWGWNDYRNNPELRSCVKVKVAALGSHP